MDYDIGEDLEPHILTTTIERCDIHCSPYKGCVEYIATGQEGVHPGSTKGFGHDSSVVFDSGVFGMLGGLFEFADIFAVTSVVGHLQGHSFIVKA